MKAKFMRPYRHWLKQHLAWVRVPILGGPLRGMSISAVSGMRFVRGDYDRDQLQQFLDMNGPGQVVYDIGAHVGYYTLAAARAVGEEGRVFAFEPLPMNFALLSGHVRANRLGNVSCLRVCISDTPGKASFSTDQGSGRGRLSTQGGLEVPVVTLDDQWSRGLLPPPDVMKIDVEGAELKLLQGATGLLSRHQPRLLLSVHSESLKEACTRLLETLGYEVQAAPRKSWQLTCLPCRDLGRSVSLG